MPGSAPSVRNCGQDEAEADQHRHGATEDLEVSFHGSAFHLMSGLRLSHLTMPTWSIAPILKPQSLDEPPMPGQRDVEAGGHIKPGHAWDLATDGIE